MISVILAIALVQTSALDDPQAPRKPPSKDQLAAITARGKQLAEYDQAAWHGSDAVQTVPIREGTVEGYIAHKTDQGWVLAFGRLRDRKGPYLVACEAVQGKSPKEFTARALNPPRADTGFFRGAARAMAIAQDDFVRTFKGPQRPFNVAVLPAEKNQWWVYFVPAQTEQGVYPLGADVRYLIAQDGSRIVEKRPLHKSLIENPPPKNDENILIMGTHTHVLSDLPEDTDVFHVLRQEKPVPEMIIGEHFVFRVETNGDIKYVGLRDEVMKP